MKKFYPLRNLFLTSGFVLILFSFAPSVKAASPASLTLTYRSLDSSHYEIQLQFIRPCLGVSQSGTINYFITNPGAKSYVKRTLKVKSISDITPICSSASKPCIPKNTYGTGDGMEEHIFLDTVDLSESAFSLYVQDCEILFEVSICCRNSDITTGAANQNFYTYALLNYCTAKGNSSPVFTNKPYGRLTCNQAYRISPGAVDFIDDDSLSFHLVNPLGNYNVPISYKQNYPFTPHYPTPYSYPYKNPSANPPIGFYFDSLSGTSIFTPAKCDEVTILVNEIREWRKDTSGQYQLIGVVRRDERFMVKINTTNNNPNILANSKYNICLGDSLCFDIETEDKAVSPSTPDSTILRWNTGIPSAHFEIINPKALNQTGRFCWKPDSGDVRIRPYLISLEALDNNCPMTGISQKTIQITVSPNVDGSFKTEYKGCGKFTTDIVPATATASNLKYNWRITNSNNKTSSAATFSNNSYTTDLAKDSGIIRINGKYYITGTLSNTFGCSIENRDSFSLNDIVTIPEIHDTALCCANLNADLKSMEPAGYTGGKWTTTYADFSIDNNSILKLNRSCSAALDTATLTYQFTGKNSGCEDTEDVKVIIGNKPVFGLKDFVRCVSDGGFSPDVSNLLKNPIDWESVDYSWSCTGCSVKEWKEIYSDSGAMPEFKVPSVDTNAFNEYPLKLTISDSIGCNFSETGKLKWIGIPEIRIIGLQPNKKLEVCSNTENKIILNANTSAHWSLSDIGAIPDIFLLDTLPTGDYTLKLESDYGCGSDEIVISVSKASDYRISPRDTSLVSSGILELDFRITPSVSNAEWMVDSGKISSTTGSTTTFTLPVNQSGKLFSYKLRMKVMSNNSCPNSEDSVRIFLRPDPCTDFSVDYSSDSVWFIPQQKNLARYFWAFDGASSTDSVGVFHRERVTRDYDVKLITTSDFGDSCELSKKVLLTSAPTAKVVSIKAVPNPVRTHLTFKEANLDSQPFRIFDLSGRLVSQGIISENSIDCSELPDGLYWIEVSGDQPIDQHYQIRIVKITQ
ncbi:MAG: T9SS type A sorting domain-containing protein [Bacteroidetes bacterium]|nr:T9SS type A sorting domain-containing protein [Bacteroidota bacterium]